MAARPSARARVAQAPAIELRNGWLARLRRVLTAHASSSSAGTRSNRPEMAMKPTRYRQNSASTRDRLARGSATARERGSEPHRPPIPGSPACPESAVSIHGSPRVCAGAVAASIGSPSTGPLRSRPGRSRFPSPSAAPFIAQTATVSAGRGDVSGLERRVAAATATRCGRSSDARRAATSLAVSAQGSRGSIRRRALW